MASVQVKTDILNAINNHEIMCHILLDLIAAFDIITYKVLLNRLKHHFGITDVALLWIVDYQTDRVQRVVVTTDCTDRAEPANKPLNQGIPQGSVWSLTLFTLYVSPLGDILKLQCFFSMGTQITLKIT